MSRKWDDVIRSCERGLTPDPYELAALLLFEEKDVPKEVREFLAAYAIKKIRPHNKLKRIDERNVVRYFYKMERESGKSKEKILDDLVKMTNLSDSRLEEFIYTDFE